MTHDSPELANQRYDKFINEVTKTKIVYGLKKDDGWANHSDEDSSLVLFWSEWDSAKLCLNSVFTDYQIVEIPLNDFIEDILPLINDHDLWIGVNLTEDMTGIDVPPTELAKALRK